MEIVLEILGTTNNVLDRQRYSQERVRIGRGYANDLIIDDEHTDVEHAELRVDETGRLWIEDLQSINGVKRVKGRKPIHHEPVESGDAFMIGRNKLRVYFQDHPLPPAVPIRPVESFLLWLGRPQVILLLLIVYLALAYLQARQSIAVEFNWSSFVGENAVDVLQFLALVACVYLLSVLFRRSGNFPSHLSVLLFVAVLSSCLGFLVQIARFNAGDNSYQLVSVFDSAQGYLAVFLYLWSVFYLAFNFSVRRRTTLSALAIVLFVFLGWVQRQALGDFDRFKGFPMEKEFLPPTLQLTSPLSADNYVAKTRKLFDEIDQRRLDVLEERDNL